MRNENAVHEVLENVRRLSPDEIRHRLAVISDEEKTLRKVLRLSLDLQKSARNADKKGHND